jgi:hypothetical protein
VAGIELEETVEGEGMRLFYLIVATLLVVSLGLLEAVTARGGW